MTSKTKRASKRKRDPLPEHFNSIEDAAEFWDAHDSSDYDEYFVGVDVKVDLKKRRTISVDGALYDRVHNIAKKKRLRTDQLVSRWLREKIRNAA